MSDMDWIHGSSLPMMGCMRRLMAMLSCAAVLLGACGDDGPESSVAVDPRAAVVSALAKTYRLETMHLEFEMRAHFGQEDISFTGSEDIDLESGAARVTMDLGMLGGSMEMMTDGTVVYMRSPTFKQAFGVGTEWVSMDVNELADGGAGNPFGGLGTSQMDPSAFLGFFAGAVEVKEAGGDTVKGVATTRYEGTIDLGKVLSGFAKVVGHDVDERQLRRGLRELKTMGLGKIPFEVWIDDEGLLRKERLTMDLGMIPGAQEGAGLEIEATFSNYGDPVDIEPPPPSQVTDVTDMATAA